MRVITGTAGGTNLKAPTGFETRPTADKVKQALFNMIQFEICGEVLDLFAGSGQLGIEALSRGAKAATFVDARRESIAVIRDNLERTHLIQKAQVFCSDYENFLKRCRKRFSIVFLDPPYAEKYLENAIKLLAEIDILEENGIIVSERPLRKDLNVEIEGFERSKDYNYGKTVITIFRRKKDSL